jgi:hypothetical protein
MEDLDSLRQVIVGEVSRPRDPAYGDARKVWNGAIDRRPAPIVHCAEVSDGVAAVRFARCVAAATVSLVTLFAREAFMIDPSLMKAIEWSRAQPRIARGRHASPAPCISCQRMGPPAPSTGMEAAGIEPALYSQRLRPCDVFRSHDPASYSCLVELPKSPGRWCRFAW